MEFFQKCFNPKNNHFLPACNGCGSGILALPRGTLLKGMLAHGKQNSEGRVPKSLGKMYFI
jgi:hypothetical protein